MCIVYQIGRGESFIYEDFGYCTYENGLVDLRISRVLARRRRNLHGHRFRAATVFLEPGSENRTDLDNYQYVNINPKFITITQKTTKLNVFSAITKLTPFQSYRY